MLCRTCGLTKAECVARTIREPRYKLMGYCYANWKHAGKPARMLAPVVAPIVAGLPAFPAPVDPVAERVEGVIGDIKAGRVSALLLRDLRSALLAQARRAKVQAV